jgi:hypothetical protein
MKVLAFKYIGENLKKEAVLTIYVQLGNLYSNIVIHATTDEWKTVQYPKTQTGYTSLHNKIVKKCKFVVSLPSTKLHPVRCCFAVYDPLSRIWDNNGGWNHCIDLGEERAHCLICYNSSKIIIPKCFYNHTYCDTCCMRMNYKCPLCKKTIQ